MRVIAIANQKGGCGKTTTAINLASSLSTRAHRVLLIDLDPQAHATLGLNTRLPEDFQDIYHVLSHGNHGFPRLDDIMVPVRDNFCLAPSSVLLCAFEQEFAGISGRENRLMEAIGGIKRAFDFIIIDCPPSIGLLSFNALRAAEDLIIPIDMSLFSLRGVTELTEMVLLIERELGHQTRARALITMYDFRTRYAKQVREKVREKFGSNVFDSVIRYNIRLRETVDFGLPIGEYDKRSIGYKDYESLADEVINAAFHVPGLGPKTLHAPRDILAEAEQCIQTVRDAREEKTPGKEPEFRRAGSL